MRNSDGLRLSEAGQRLLPHIERALTNLDAIRTEAAGLSPLDGGNLRIAAVPSLLATILPPILKEFRVRFPGVELSIFEGTDQEIRTWTTTNLAHVGFAALPMEGVVAEELTQDEWLALIPKNLFKEQSTISLRELSEHRFLLSGGGCETHVQGIFAGAKVALTDHLAVKQLPTIQAMVAEGLGVSLVPSLSVTNLHAGIRTLQLKPRRFRKIGMVFAAGPRQPAVTAWDELVKQRLQHPKKKSTRRQSRAR